ncbi:LacI family DNA-binding transcriptional regulator [Klugiella xanthotipulae]|uniref:LacI family transcriptional regulator n=1 Tax=Klugiella xanthotipulae TaxID=244735 RepID=A0A543HY61_9MICO|nr:LacI family DNA-binding transcriptional regulator [Klugiella xanthotipulae]TQM63286.1 LacI family transcriptional regulator [Klugiella xanthotipulae]
MDVTEPVTLKTLAGELGLNVSTVSRVINAEPGTEAKWASPATIRRIQELAHERGYARNPHAASLRTSRSDLVGVIVPRLQDYVLATIYEGIDAAAEASGRVTVVANSLDDPARQRLRTESLLARRVDGLIFGDAHQDSPYLDELAARGVPLTLVSRRRAGHVSVTCDDIAGGRLAATHLVSTGRRRFAVIAGARYASTTLDRVGGFLAVLAEHGIGESEVDLHYTGFDAPAGQRAIADILGTDTRPEAVFAVNDFAAIGAIGALQKRGISVPDDIAVVGYNDTPIAQAVNLTTVRSPMIEMGRLGFDKLLALIDKEAVDSERLTPEFVVRSTA